MNTRDVDFIDRRENSSVYAQLNNASAHYNLATMYRKGRGVAQDYTEAAKWYRLAAQQGDAKAQFNLGMFYYNGQGVAQDCVIAYMWINLSAEQCNPKALKYRDIVAATMTPEEIAEARAMARRGEASH